MHPCFPKKGNHVNPSDGEAVSLSVSEPLVPLLEPLALLERLAALVPQPRRHLLTYQGVLAPATQGQERIVTGLRVEIGRVRNRNDPLDPALERGTQWPPRPCPPTRGPAKGWLAGCGGFGIPIRLNGRSTESNEARYPHLESLVR